MSFRFNQGDRPLPGYTIERGVGRGGFGEVYYALSDGGKEVALKFLRDNPEVELRGSTHCLNLKSPHLVGIQDIKQSPTGDWFVVMEFVSGPSLRDLLNEEPAGLGVQKAAYFLREICKGLAYLHDRGIVHRDLKPGNIFYEEGYVKIGDYGLSKLMAASQHSGQTMSVGTVHYMAPEVGSGNYDRTIDLYALGVMLYEMLLGRVPYSGASMGEVLMKHLTAQPEVDELPAPFPQVIRKALAKDPRDRYQTVNELISDVFSVDEVSQRVDAIDSLNLTRMAAAVAKKVKAGGGSAGLGGGGSSNAVTLAAPTPIQPPPIIEEGRRGRRRERMRHERGRDRDRDRGRDRQVGVDQQAVPATGVLPFPQRSRVTTGLLGLFLGPFGVHRFYTGHYSIGVWQLIASFFTGGLAGLWGITEGVIILTTGDYLDAHGRPLIDRSQSDPLYRNVLVRAFWGILSIITGLGAIGMSIGATFAPGEYAFYRINGDYLYFNSLYWMFVGSSFAAALTGFAVWKAAHRGGLSFWRVTIRPALMAFAAGLGASSFAAARLLVPYDVQLPLIGLSVICAIAFVKLWMLRGSEYIFRQGDVYWNRAIARLFVFGVLMLGSCSAMSWFMWHRADYSWAIGNNGERQTQLTREELPYEQRNGKSPTRVANVAFAYNQWPILMTLGGILAVGCGIEADHRRRMANRAEKALSDQA